MPRAIAALRPLALLKWVAPPLAVFAALLGVLALVNRSSGARPRPSPADGADGASRQPASLDTEGQIEQLQAAVRADPDDAGTYALPRRRLLPARSRDGRPELLHARRRLLRARRWPGTRRTSRPSRPGDPGAGPPRLQRRACGSRSGPRALAPQMALPYAPLADAQIELGRYGAAAPHAEPDGSPEGEPHGLCADLLLPRAARRPLAERCRRCASRSRPGSGAPRARPTSRGCWASSWLDRGRYAAAEHAYREALAINPGYPPALAGIAGVEARPAASSHAAIRDYRQAVERLPLPEYAIALGRDRAGRRQAAAAKRDYALVGAEVKLLHANGVNTDVDLALFEANHGSSRAAVSFGRRAWQQAPSVRSADAYSWALYAAGRIGPADALLASRR